MSPGLIVVVAAALALLGGCASDPDAPFAQKQKLQREIPGIVGKGAEDTAAAGEWLVFSSFRDGEFGLRLLLSRDGYTWTPAAVQQPVQMPAVGGLRGMRDPCVAQGPDGMFHLVWTWAEGGPQASREIGYAHSRDLLHWEDVRSVQVIPPDWKAVTCWAPELVYEAPRQRWLIAFSADIADRFPATRGMAETNHRLYLATTTDFRTATAAQLLLDPGYPVIDPAFLEWNGSWVLFFKDERKTPEKKQLRMTTGPTPEGPWGEISPGLTIHWSEAPSAIRLGEDAVVYFDEYTHGTYGAIRSRDLKTWDDVSRLMSFPPGHRHGSAIRVPSAIAAGLGAGAPQ